MALSPTGGAHARWCARASSADPTPRRRPLIPLLLPGDIRYRYELGGGALMDIGSYAVNMVFFLAGAEPEVVSASEAHLASRPRPRARSASRTAAAGASPARWRRCGCSASIRGRQPRHASSPLAPHYHRLTVATPAVPRRVMRGEPTYQSAAHSAPRAAARASPPTRDDRQHARDACYRAAGLPLRGTRGLLRLVASGGAETAGCGGRTSGGRRTAASSVQPVRRIVTTS
jgi:hypothetical protein